LAQLLRMFTILWLALGIPLAGCSARVDPETGRVRIIFLGEVATTNELFLGCLLYTSPSPRD